MWRVATVLLASAAAMVIWLALIALCGCTLVSSNRVFPKPTWYWSAEAKQQKRAREITNPPDYSTLTNKPPLSSAKASANVAAAGTARTPDVAAVVPPASRFLVWTNSADWCANRVMAATNLLGPWREYAFFTNTTNAWVRLAIDQTNGQEFFRVSVVRY